MFQTGGAGSEQMHAEFTLDPLAAYGLYGAKVATAIARDSSTIAGRGVVRAAVASNPSAFGEGVVAAMLCKGNMLKEVATLLHSGGAALLKRALGGKWNFITRCKLSAH